jgi:hypothetical protein
LLEIADEVADAGCKLVAEDASRRSVLNDRVVPGVGHSAEPAHRLDPVRFLLSPGKNFFPLVGAFLPPHTTPFLGITEPASLFVAVSAESLRRPNAASCRSVAPSPR